MKKTFLLSSLSLASAAALVAAPNEETTQLQGFPKNLARQHLGANLYQYQPASQMFTPAQVSAAWLDDDVTTGWSAMAGRQYYLLALPQAELISNFALSARPASGTVSLYVGDSPAAPTAASWSPVAKEVSLESVNERKLAQPISRVAKYLLIETNIADPGPIYSLYVYGEKPATAYAIQGRAQPIDTSAVFGAYVNDSTTFNVAGLYAQSLVKHPDGTFDVGAQRAIDDNPDTFTTLAASGTAAELPVSLASTRSVSRVAVKVEPGAKGRLEILTKDTAAAGNDAAATAVSSILLDGSSARASVDFPATQANLLTVRWVPANGSDSLSLAEVEAFGGTSLASSTVSLQGDTTTPTRLASNAERRSSGDGKETNDPKAIADGKDAKDAKAAPIAEDPIAAGGPYLPGALGFPPNLTNRGFRVPPPIPPETPVSN